MTLSFFVESITEEALFGTKITRFQTVLRHYNSQETLTITGKYWKVGQKVDFAELVNENVHAASKN